MIKLKNEHVCIAMQALQHVLVALPIALPLAMGHSAAEIVSLQLRNVLKLNNTHVYIALQALQHVLVALPIALPLAMGHSAAEMASAQLRNVVSPMDAARLDKLYRLVSEDDASCTVLRSVLGPLMESLPE